MSVLRIGWLPAQTKHSHIPHACHQRRARLTISLVPTGSLSHEELARSTDHFILLDHTRESLHNQLVCALQANVLRDVPEAGVASWVSSNDKPTAVVKHVSGDVAEQRLRTEVMQLPPKVRARLKGINDVRPIVDMSTVSRRHAERDSLDY